MKNKSSKSEVFGWLGALGLLLTITISDITIPQKILLTAVLCIVISVIIGISEYSPA